MASAPSSSDRGPEQPSDPTLLLTPSLPPEVLVLDAKLRVIETTARARDWLQLRPGRRQTAAALPAALRSLARAALKSAPGTPPRQAELSAGGRRGGRLQAMALSVPLTAGARAVLILLQDRELLQRAETSLGELQRLSCLGWLTAGLVHELKNALVPVKTFVDLVLEKNPDAALAEDARRELQRINSLVEQVLRFSRTGRHPIGPVHVHQVLDEALRLVQRRIEERLVTLRRHFEAETDLIRGDAVQLQQTFLNLLLNALDAMSANGVLTVATTVERVPTTAGRGRARRAGALGAATGTATRLCVSISDTGVGIAAGDLERVFDPFFTTKPGGTGLGLAIARRIAREHGGDITVHSEPNKGTTFRVALPLAGPPARAATRPARKAA